MQKQKVLVAMSGGVDSSVAAALLLDMGYEVEGCTMQIWPDESNECDNQQSNGCCSLSAVDDARLVCMKLKIKYHVSNFKDIFEQSVITPFVQQYAKGITPNPCIECNRIVKFEEFLRRAKVLGFDYIATGHYGIINYNTVSERYELSQSITQAKDQSYALYTLTQNQLAHLLLPIGNMTKDEVRDYAKKRNLPVFDKPDSQEICFVKDNDYAGFIRGRGVNSPIGNFVDIEGNILGKHKGIIHYTVGQRKGLGLSFKQPHFVIELRVDTNEVVLSTAEKTYTDYMLINNLNLIKYDKIEEALNLQVKIRYKSPVVNCTVSPEGNGVYKIAFALPQRAVTPGQAAVLYDGLDVVGGGTIL